MDLALYHPQLGYYARTARRSGRAGDFVTSVDVGSLFGRLLAQQVAELADLLAASPRAPVPADGQPAPDRRSPGGSGAAAAFDLVEAGAGDGRLSADLLRELQRSRPDVYARTRLHLVEVSEPARREHRSVLGHLADRLASSGPSLPDAFEGVLLANELLDAFPVHQVVMRTDGLREVFVRAATPSDRSDPELDLIEGEPSTPLLEEYLDRVDAALEPGWRAEINLRAPAWVAEAARRLRRGFMLIIDYGHDARDLYSVRHAGGTLTAISRHTVRGPAPPAPPRTGPAQPRPGWLAEPGDRDLTAHVDFTAIRGAAEASGLEVVAFTDQTYFLLGLFSSDRLRDLDLRDRLALKTLTMPGGLGSTHKVLILAKGVRVGPLA